MKRDFFYGIAVLLLGGVLFIVANANRHYQITQSSRISVSMPVPMQLLATFGDRYLAANLAAWRVLMTGGENMPRDSLDTLARIQEDASFLNPAHEDNYVMATALLPWEGYVESTQLILRRATTARKNDHFAPFFYGFNQIHFLKDANGAFEYGQIAVSHALEEGDRQALTVISAAWLERGSDPAMAEKIIGLMAGGLNDPVLKRHLEQRAERQKIVAELQIATDKFIAQVGRPLKQLEELVEQGLVGRIPDDPVGTTEFIVDHAGKIGFRQKVSKM